MLVKHARCLTSDFGSIHEIQRLHNTVLNHVTLAGSYRGGPLNE